MRYLITTLLLGAMLCSCDDQAAIIVDDDARVDATDISMEDSNDSRSMSSGIDTNPTWSGCVVVEPSRVEWVNPHPDRVWFYGEILAFKTREDFIARLGAEPPSAVQFPDEWALLVLGMEAVAPMAITLERLEFCPQQIEIAGAVDYGEPCQLPNATSWPPYAMYKISAQAGSVKFEGGVGNFRQDRYSCEDDGAQLGAKCGTSGLCQLDGICAGVTEAVDGICVPSEYLGEFVHSVATLVPDGDALGVTIGNDVVGVPGLIADVVVQLELDHASFGDLVMLLSSPSGTEQIIWSKEAESLPMGTLQRPVWGFAGEQPNGEWRLTVVDDVLGNTGEIDRWTLSVVTVPE